MTEQGAPAWMRVRDALVADIESGLYPVKSQLPSLSQLTDAFGVSRTPVQKALRELKEAGVLRGHAGSGVFIAARPSDLPEPPESEADLRELVLDLRRRVEALEGQRARGRK